MLRRDVNDGGAGDKQQTGFLKRHRIRTFPPHRIFSGGFFDLEEALGRIEPRKEQPVRKLETTRANKLILILFIVLKPPVTYGTLGWCRCS